MTFDDVIRPVASDDFVASYLNQSYIRIVGLRGRFQELVPWDSLNSVLADLDFSSGRLKVIRNGKSVTPSEYVNNAQGELGARINPRGLERRLRLGDTLLFIGAHDYFPELRKIVDSLHRMFRIKINANIYIGFRHLRGFDLHWDHHDTLIIQVHGRKSWHVYAPTKLFPVSFDRPQDMVRPTADPVWSGFLESGDVLYMPRGWWHVAEPVDGPSLHVTFGFAQPTGLELVSWLLEELKEVEAMRRPLPVFGVQQDRDSYVRALVDEISRRLSAESVERYFRWSESAFFSQRFPALPEAAQGDDEFDSTTPLLLAVCGRIHFVRLSHDEIGFWSAKKFWRCAAVLEPALQRLDDRQGICLDALLASVATEARQSLRLFVTTLIEFGVVVPDRQWKRAALLPASGK
jgi:hypothetical protein